MLLADCRNWMGLMLLGIAVSPFVAGGVWLCASYWLRSLRGPRKGPWSVSLAELITFVLILTPAMAWIGQGQIFWGCAVLVVTLLGAKLGSLYAQSRDWDGPRKPWYAAASLAGGAVVYGGACSVGMLWIGEVASDAMMGV